MLFGSVAESATSGPCDIQRRLPLKLPCIVAIKPDVLRSVCPCAHPVILFRSCSCPQTRIFSHLNHSTLAADKVSCGTALDACSLGFSWGGALQTFQQMQGQTLRANSWTISSAVSSCEMSLHPSTALGFVLRSVANLRPKRLDDTG